MKPFFPTAETFAHFLSNSPSLFFVVVAIITSNFDTETALRSQALSVLSALFQVEGEHVGGGSVEG